jgi:hypothetical protein
MSSKSVSAKSVVATLAAREGVTYISKSDVKDALRAAAKVAGGKWGLVNIVENTFTITREDGSTLVAERKVGSPVTLTVAGEVKVAPAKAEKPAKVKPAKVVEAKVEEAVQEGVSAAPAKSKAPAKPRKPKAEKVVAVAPPIEVVVGDSEVPF